MNLRSASRHVWAEWIRPLALPLLLVAAAKSALADINYVPSGSMHPTLLDGDVVLVNKLAYGFRVPFTFAHVAHWADPARGDIVVCFEPKEGTRLVKRVVGLPGDTVELRSDHLYVNGAALAYRPLPEASAHGLPPDERNTAVLASEHLGERDHAVMVLPGRPALRTFGPVTLGRGEYFVMGDNRDNSRDSRYFGPMPREKIIGRVNRVVVSGDIHQYLRPRLDRFFSSVE